MFYCSKKSLEVNCDHEVDFTGRTGFTLRTPFTGLIPLTPLTGRIPQTGRTGPPDASSVKKTHAPELSLTHPSVNLPK